MYLWGVTLLSAIIGLVYVWLGAGPEHNALETIGSALLNGAMIGLVLIAYRHDSTKRQVVDRNVD